MQLYDPALFGARSDHFGFALKTEFAPGATSAGVALDTALAIGLSARGGPLMLSGLFGVAGGLLDVRPILDRRSDLVWSLDTRLRADLGRSYLLEAAYERRTFPLSNLFSETVTGEHHLTGRFLFSFNPRSVWWGIKGRYSIYNSASAATFGLELWL